MNLSQRGQSQAGWRLLVKQTIDGTVAATGLVAASPMFAGVALAIRLSMGPPVFFRQARPGRGGRPFEILKFRTMLDALGADGQPLPDDQRLTSLGRFLRATSLDELPQLINVLKGELSLVGPRPLLTRYLPRYSSRQKRRHDVLPGITGWAQVNGRNAISWDEKFELDVWYVENWSLLLDAQILARTVLKVLKREGVSREGHATMPEFMGSKSGFEEGA